MTITWITQGGFIFEASSSERVAVDPYLSDSLASKGFTRITPIPMQPSALAADMVVCTHDHLDHLDPDTVRSVAASHPKCRFAGPLSVQNHLQSLAINCEPLDESGEVAIGRMRVRGVIAFHSDPHAIGLLIECDNQRIYLTADTILRPALVEAALALGPIDVLLVCINGRMGNMSDVDAVSLASALRPRVTVPMHYGLFKENTADPAVFVASCDRAGLCARTFVVGRVTDLQSLL